MVRTTGGIIALLGGGSLFLDRDVPVVRVNEDDSLLAHWPSEAYSAPADTPPECVFYAFKERFEGTLCTHFTLGRSSSLPARASERALRCAAAFGTECVLSPEIGLAIPAAFLYGESGRMVTVLGPKLLQTDSEQQHVRVSPPDGDGLTDTRTLLLNRTVRVEYLDATSRTLVASEFSGERAYCIQLLRQAFEPRCWEQLD